MDGSGSYSEAGHQTASLALLGISDFGQRAERSDVGRFAVRHLPTVITPNCHPVTTEWQIDEEE